ncbi:MAG: hypothetical protein PHN84_03300 [Desulfuromonadaceae bacterium]|nr:hypothetical protein [Desulfuromonadaceae bacterium]
MHDPTWFEHVDLMQTMMGSLFLILGWFMIRTLHSIEKSIGILFKKYEEIDKNHDALRGEFNQLRGEHIARHS